MPDVFLRKDAAEKLREEMENLEDILGEDPDLSEVVHLVVADARRYRRMKSGGNERSYSTP